MSENLSQCRLWPKFALAQGITLAFCFLTSLSSAQEVEVINAHQSFVKRVFFSSDMKKFVTLGAGGVKVWDSVSLKRLADIHDFRFKLQADTALSRDGKILAITGFEEPARLYDSSSWEIKHKLGESKESTRGVAFSADGKIVALATSNNSITFWDPNSGKRIGSVDVDFSLSSIAFSPDGITLVGSGFPGHLVLWDWPSKKERATLEGHKGNVHKIVFSPNSKILVTLDLGGVEGPVLGRLGRAFLWDPATGKKKGELSLKDVLNRPLDAAFSPDSKTLAVVGDGYTLLWDIPTNRRLTILEKPEMSYESVAFFPDGKKLLLGHRNGSLFIVDVPQIKLPDPKTEDLFAELGHKDALTRADAMLALLKSGKGVLEDLEKLQKKATKDDVREQARIVISYLKGPGIDVAMQRLVGRAAPAGIDSFVNALVESREEGKDIAWKTALDLARTAANAAKLRGGGYFPDAEFLKFPVLFGKNIDEETISDKRVSCEAAYFRTGAEQCFVVCRQSFVANHELSKSIVFANGKVHIRGGLKQSIIICAGNVSVEGPIVQSLVLARGNIEAKGQKIELSVVERNEPNPLRLFKFTK